jgi:hypothetical protein
MGTTAGFAALGSNTAHGGLLTLQDTTIAGDLVGFTFFNFGAACVFRNSSNELEFYGYDGTAYHPVMALIATPTKSQLEVRIPNDSRGITAYYPSSGNPRITVSTPAGMNIAGTDLEIGGGPSTGNGTPGALSLMAAVAGGSGSAENVLVEIVKVRGTDVIVNDNIALRIGNTNVASTGHIRLRTLGSIYARNNANTANLAVVDTTSGDVVRIGGDGSNVGGIEFQPGTNDIKWGKALVALGGGATPIFGTIGGSGPATAAQNTWMRALDSAGAAFWVPAWK